MRQILGRGRTTLKKRDEKQTSGLEDNLKKALAEFPDILCIRSQGAVDVMFPYPVIYRTTESGYLEATQKRVAPDGRRQYYKRALLI